MRLSPPINDLHPNQFLLYYSKDYKPQPRSKIDLVTIVGSVASILNFIDFF
jgi:hypothetical protein